MTTATSNQQQSKQARPTSRKTPAEAELEPEMIDAERELQSGSQLESAAVKSSGERAPPARELDSDAELDDAENNNNYIEAASDKILQKVSSILRVGPVLGPLGPFGLVRAYSSSTLYHRVALAYSRRDRLLDRPRRYIRLLATGANTRVPASERAR